MKFAHVLFAAPLIALSLSASTAPLVTFTHDVAPILYKHCVACHHPNDIAPMSLLTYKETCPWAASIRQVSRHRQNATLESRPPFWVSCRTTPASPPLEIATHQSLGPRGTNSKAIPRICRPAPQFTDGWKIGKPDAIISIPEQTIEATGPDEYIYVNVPTNFKEDRWIVAAELRPGNRRIVHHAHVFVIDPPNPYKATKEKRRRKRSTARICKLAKSSPRQS